MWYRIKHAKLETSDRLENSDSSKDPAQKRRWQTAWEDKAAHTLEVANENTKQNPTISLLLHF